MQVFPGPLVSLEEKFHLTGKMWLSGVLSYGSVTYTNNIKDASIYLVSFYVRVCFWWNIVDGHSIGLAIYKATSYDGNRPSLTHLVFWGVLGIHWSCIKEVYLTNFDSVMSPMTTYYGRYWTYCTRWGRIFTLQMFITLVVKEVLH